MGEFDLNNSKFLYMHSFDSRALALFHHQASANPIYKAYVEALGRDAKSINQINEIPFLPIQFFKEHEVKTDNWREETIFTSSGTTGAITSQHFVKSTADYLQQCEKCFQQYYGAIEDTVFLCLLPSYLEREGSSLVLMAEHFIEKSGVKASGFYLYDFEQLKNELLQLKGGGKRVVLLGVTFALLDFADRYSISYPELIVMETGGMKGRRREMIREEVHDQLKIAFDVNYIHSEYGMTELFSQAYSQGDGIFKPTSDMRIILRDVNDPFDLQPSRAYGAINVIDLANIHTCAFIETQDLGKLHSDGTFEVLGRIDNSDLRGCNLLVY